MIPGAEFQVQTSTAPNHTDEMLKDATSDLGHHDFVVDTEAMTALVYDYATKPKFRAVVAKEFKAIPAIAVTDDTKGGGVVLYSMNPDVYVYCIKKCVRGDEHTG